jgi:hypothetical protein
MSPRGTKQRPSFTKVAPSVSPDDVLKLIQERDQCIAPDTRTAAERWLGERTDRHWRNERVPLVRAVQLGISALGQ